jgi:hypothetical protein
MSFEEEKDSAGAGSADDGADNDSPDNNNANNNNNNNNNDGSLSPSKPGTASQQGPRGTGLSSAKPQTPQFPTEQLIQRNLYPYIRWVWMQFPWMALHPASKWSGSGCNYDLSGDGFNGGGSQIGAITNGGSSSGGGGGGGGGAATGGLAKIGGAKDDAALDHNSNTLNALTGAAMSKRDMSKSLTASDNKRLLRVWNIKKSDPTVLLFEKSEARRTASLKPKTMSSAAIEKSVEVAVDTLYEEMTDFSHVTKVKIGVVVKDKYRRTLEQNAELMGRIPFAYPCNRSKKANSMFPTYDMMIREEVRTRVCSACVV